MIRNRRRRIRYRARRWRLVLSVVMFLTGFVWASGSSLAEDLMRDTRYYDFSDIWRSQFFYGGDVRDQAVFLAALPRPDEDESGNGDSAIQWDVALRDGASGREPVFVRAVRTTSGQTTGSVAVLAARPAANLALQPLQSDTVRVLIYCSHSGETYADGETTVMDVAAKLAETLKNQYGIGAVADGTIHDTDWSMSYSRSQETAKKLLEQYPDAELMIDLHRDSGPTKDDVTFSSTEGSAARVLLVVGSNLKYEHPNWEQNHATATALAAAADAAVPNLIRAVRVQAGRYNQHLTPNAVLFEVGADVTLGAEALRSAELLAAAIHTYLEPSEE